MGLAPQTPRRNSRGSAAPRRSGWAPSVLLCLDIHDGEGHVVFERWLTAAATGPFA